MRRACLIPPLLAVLGVAAPAAAQTAPASEGWRQLTWAGRPAATAAPTPEAAASPAPEAPRRAGLVIPHGGAARVTPPPAPVSIPASVCAAPTAANAWLRAAAPALPSQPQPQPAAAPVERTRPAPPVAQPAAQPRPLPAWTAQRAEQPAPVEAIALAPEAAPAPAPVDDPMAPRRDAPIFRLQQQAAAPAPAAEASAAPTASAAEARAPRLVATVQANPDDRPMAQGSRYYSLHRPNGRTPDAVAIPEGSYVDALAVTLTQTPASQDLAQPDAPPSLIRDAQGRVRPAPAAPEGDYQ